MSRRKRPFINLFDIIAVLLIAAFVVLMILFVSPSGKTVTVDYTLYVSEGDAEALSEGDALTVISGGCLGTVTKAADGSIKASAEAEYHAGCFYTGSSALKEGKEYVIVTGTNRIVCTLVNITKR